MIARAKTIAIVDALAGLALVAWVGGHAALGAFAARIIFRDQPRTLAAPTMNAVFRSFDSLLTVAIAILAITLVIRLWLRPLQGQKALLALGAGLVAIGLFEVSYVHPQIESLFMAGRTLEPWFQSLHRISEKCGHLEVIFTAGFFVAQKWPLA